MRIDIKGREDELARLKEKYSSKKSELIVIYGRRRVGKSSLIQSFINRRRTSTTKQALALTFEGLENQKTPAQIKHFTARLKAQIKDPLLQRVEFENWSEVFDFLTTYFSEQKEKTIVAFDEFQWMAANQTKLVALVKYYWDNHWKQSKVMLILCGSIASFMVKKVIRSNALYGRFSLELHLKKLTISECREFFPSARSADSVLRLILVFGGVPKYLEEINMKLSFEQNLETLFFAENALFLEEFDKIFNVHFKEPKNYLTIVKALHRKALNLEEISQKLKMKSSGGVRAYLENLEMAEFIQPSFSYLNNSGKSGKYRLADEFINFYTNFVLPNKRIIKSGGGRKLFRNKIAKQLTPWFGIALENYIINNGIYFAEKMGFGDLVESFGGYYNKKESVQIDLIYLRSDKTVPICEIKFRQQTISTEVIPEYELKLKKLPLKPNYSIHKVLIAPNGVTEALRLSEYFDEILTSEELFS